MKAAVVQSLRIVATPKAVDRLCSAKRTMIDLEGLSVWDDIKEARYKRAARIVKRGLG